MKFTKQISTICMALCLAVVALNMISAAVDVTYHAHYAVIQADGDIDYSTATVSDFDTSGYVCTSADCSTINAALGQLTGTSRSTATDTITLTYPTALQNSNGYGVYFYKQGYIGWEMNPNWQGTGTAPDTYDVYFLRKETGYAPIMNLNVVNEVNPNIPVEVGLQVGIDADTHSAIENNGPLAYEPAEIDATNSVDTLVTLEIRDSDGRVVYTDSTSVSVPYSESVPVSFTCPGLANTGDYSVTVYTDVTDVKILNPQRQEASSEIRVIPQNLRDYGYTLINGFEMSPAHPDEDETVTFSFDYLSNYMDAAGALTGVDTRVVVNIYKDNTRTNTKIYTLTPATTTYSFTKDFSAGKYRIVIEGIPTNSALLTGKTIVPSTQEIRFNVDEVQTNDNNDNNKKTEDNVDSDKPLTLESGSAINLGGNEKMLGYKKLLYGLGIGILILIILILAVAAYKFSK